MMISKRGILFKDITPLLIDPKPQRMPKILVSLKDKKKTKSSGGESRLFFGMLIAQELNVGFVPSENQQAALRHHFLPMSWNTGKDTRNTH
jgi:adenine/guanine phosphoribosyltransferase-like PRPP-binding protein